MQHVTRGQRRRAVHESRVAVGLQDAVGLGQEAIDVRKVMRRRADDVKVERVVLERKVRGVPDHPIRVDDVAFGGDTAGLVQHLPSHVETDHPADVRRKSERGVARASGHVEREVAALRTRQVEHLLQPHRGGVERRLRIVGGDPREAVPDVRHRRGV